MKGYIQQTDQSVPVERKGFWYYHRTVEGLAYPIHCRREGSMEAPEQVILDINALAEGHDYTSVSAVAISPDQTQLAYAVDHTGRELFDVVVVDLQTDAVLDVSLKQTGGDITWAADSRTLFFDVLDETLRPWQIRRHIVGTDGDDPVVMEETDPRFRLFTSRTRSDAWLVVGATSQPDLRDVGDPRTRPHGRSPVSGAPARRYAVPRRPPRRPVLRDDERRRRR